MIKIINILLSDLPVQLKYKVNNDQIHQRAFGEIWMKDAIDTYPI